MKDQIPSINDFAAVQTNAQRARFVSALVGPSSSVRAKAPRTPMTRARLISILDAAINLFEDDAVTELMNSANK
jgi:hypothetical protein